MQFSIGTAIILTVIAAGMWGSWMQVVKFLNGYPLTGLVFWLYTFSLVLVWAITLCMAPGILDESIPAITAQNQRIVIKILVSGGMMSLGLYCSLTVIGSVGLVLSTTVSGGVGTILGVVTSILEEGLPEGARVFVLLVLTVIIVIAAGFLGAFASKSRDEDHQGKQSENNEEEKVTLKLIIIMLLSAVLTNGWSMGTATGTAAGLPSILTCAYMATGSFLSIAVISLIMFTAKKQWGEVLCIGTSKKPILLSAISALCHYGGNVISIYSMPMISATVSFLLGRSSALWTIFWGMFHHEFSNTSRKTKTYLGASIALYLTGILLLTLSKLG